jgi:queuine/archaeosine tRNA-ribosyltransferase
LLTIHNVVWTFHLVERIRAAIAAGSLAGLRDEVAERWSPGGGAGPAADDERGDGGR